MKRLLPALAHLLIPGLLVTAVMIRPGASVADAPAPAAVDNSAQLQAMKTMSPAERRAHLKTMTATERRGLWMQLRRERAQEQGQSLRKRGDAATPHALTGDRQPSLPQRVVGSITYDNGTATTSFNTGTIVGNRFNTHTGVPVFTSGTVSTVQAVVVQGSGFTTSSAGFVLLGPQTGGGGAMAIFSSFTAATGTMDTVTFTGIGAGYTGSSFYVLFGDFSNSYVPAFGTGTTLAQGHHGVMGNTGGMGPNITATTPLTTLNALIRATGNIVPVELMSFDVE